MADEREPTRNGLDGWADRIDVDPAAFSAIVAVTAVAILARLVFLEARPMHYDEGRVAFYGLQGAREGIWSYRPVVHGPLMQHFNRWLFPLFGSGDFVARLPVALVGGLLPATALLFRERLRDLELVALSALLSVNPLLLYYSRFMRSDVLVAGFALVTLGLLVRLAETRHPAYLYAASGTFALAFASKENAFVYVLCWVGMFGLVAFLEVLDPRRFESRSALFEAANERWTMAVERLEEGGARRVAGHGLGALVLFLVLLGFLFAPRAPSGAGVGLWHSGPVIVAKYVIVDITCGLEFWSPFREIPLPSSVVPGGERTYCAGFGNDENPLEHYARDMGRQLQVLGKTASTVAVLSVIGVIAEFRRPVPRVLVPAAFYWGVASLLGYPIGSDILFPAWVGIHTVVPLAIPAAAGAVALGEWTVEAVADGDPLPAASTVLAVILLVGSTLGAAAHHSYVASTGTYWDSGEGQMVQFAQPEHATKGAIDATARASASAEHLDVLVYEGGGSSTLVDMGGPNEKAVPCMKFLRSLPLSWYFYSDGADVACADDRQTLEEGLASDPPVVVTTAGSARDVRGDLGPDYVAATYELRRGSREIVFFFDRTRVDPPARAETDSGDVR